MVIGRSCGGFFNRIEIGRENLMKINFSQIKNKIAL